MTVAVDAAVELHHAEGTKLTNRFRQLRNCWLRAGRVSAGAEVTRQWTDREPAFVARRYDQVASLIPLFEWLLFLPTHLRRRAAQRLNLKRGDRVLEIGCGTGRNFAHLREHIGPEGKLFGVDLSAGMLARARDLCAREHWTNVHLTQGDAAEFVAPEPLDGVLFGLSYNTMPHHRAVLQNAMKQLRPGGRIVIVDAKVPDGWELLRPFGVWLMQCTLLGNPYLRPWDELAAVAENCASDDFLFGSYYIAHGRKPLAAARSDRAAVGLAAE